MDQVSLCNRQLSKFVKGELKEKTVVIDVLLALEKSTITYDILKQTKVGQTVAKLRKHNDEEIATKAKFLVRKWKTIAMSPRADAASTPSLVATTETKKKSNTKPIKRKSSPSRAFVPKPIGLSTLREQVRVKLVTILSSGDGDDESAGTEVSLVNFDTVVRKLSDD